jgi:hypothetical protein
MISKTIFAAAVVSAAFASSAAWAQSAAGEQPSATLTVVIDATAGPVLQGSDPLGLNGQSASLTLLASESLKPKKHTKTSATYKIPAGAVTVTFNGNSYQTTAPSKLTVKLGKSADTMTLVSVVTQEGITVTITDTTSLAPGSWTNAVLKSLSPFTPSPQTLTEPSSKLKYSVGVFGTTVVGITGTASASDAPDPILPDADAE